MSWKPSFEKMAEKTVKKNIVKKIVRIEEYCEKPINFIKSWRKLLNLKKLQGKIFVIEKTKITIDFQKLAEKYFKLGKITKKFLKKIWLVKSFWIWKMSGKSWARENNEKNCEIGESCKKQC